MPRLLACLYLPAGNSCEPLSASSVRSVPWTYSIFLGRLDVLWMHTRYGMDGPASGNERGYRCPTSNIGGIQCFLTQRPKPALCRHWALGAMARGQHTIYSARISMLCLILTVNRTIFSIFAPSTTGHVINTASRVFSISISEDYQASVWVWASIRLVLPLQRHIR